MRAADQRQVRRRRVFYIPGYDPIHPRRYRELYRREGAEQAKISGYRIALQPRRGGGPYGWEVASEQDGAQVQADVEVLTWSDIVRESMSDSIGATYLQLVRTAWAYIGSGALFRLMRLRKGPVIAALYPVAVLILQALVAGLAGAFVAWALLALWALLLPPLVLRWLLAAVALVVVAGAVLRWFRRRDGRIYAWYLMHDYAHTASLHGAWPPAMAARLRTFRERIRDALREDVDEVLVVGHSSGAHLGVSVLAGLIRDGIQDGAQNGGLPADGPVLSFLTLGQVVPMLSFLPEARELRRDLAFLSQRDELTWVDVSAPGDGCTFALCDPVAVSGVAPEGQLWPLILSAAFSQTLSPARWQQLRRRFFRLHFQYLCAFDRPGDYDYFRITAGPLTLAARYAGRAPSRSAIRRAVSRHVST